jgi:hypothetical protein
MANLPTAYASQRFGRKTLDFYAVEGEVAGADPRARADERRLQDIDGARHTVRLMEAGFALEPGQTATVLRMQPGPARRSRPVAVVNHDTGAWCRTHPGAEGLLAKAGVSRTFNWVLTLALFAVAALAVVWPFLRAFLVEVDPALFGASPAFNVAELAAGALPALTGWTFADAVAPISAALANAVPAVAAFADALVFGAGVLIAALGVYVLRSWRLLWAPLFVVALGAVALGFGGVAGMTGPALSGLGLAAFVFVLGGLINRIRDGARLEARIAVLADHVLRQGPQDAVAPAEAAADDAAAGDDIEAEPVEALAPAVAATAASLREPVDSEEEAAAEDAAATAPETDAAAEAAVEADTVEGEAAQDALVDVDPVEETPEPAEADSADEPADAAVEESGAEPSDAAPEAEPVSADMGAPTEADEAAEAEPETAGDAPEAVIIAKDAANDTAPEAEAPVESAEAPDAPVTAAPEAVEAEAEVEEAPAVQDQDASEPSAPAAPEASESAPVAVTDSETKAEAPAADTDTAPAGLDPEEAERLRTDPRYASRAIVLPPPPPMPEATRAQGEGSGEAVGQRETQTLKPDAPLPDNVIPIFAAPASSEIAPSASAAEAPDADAPKDD